MPIFRKREMRNNLVIKDEISKCIRRKTYLSFFLSFSVSVSLSLSLSLFLPFSLSLSLSHTHTHTLSLSLPLSHSLFLFIYIYIYKSTNFIHLYILTIIYIYIYIYICIYICILFSFRQWSSWLGFNLGRFISKTQKWYLMSPCLTLSIVTYRSWTSDANQRKK